MNDREKLSRRRVLGGFLLLAPATLALASCGGAASATVNSATAANSAAAATAATSAPAATTQSAAAATTQSAASATQAAQSAAAPSGQPVTLIESSWATDTYGQSREQARIDLFKKTYPTAPITVNLRNTASSSYTEQILTQLAGGVGPDVFRLSWQNVFPFKEQGAIPALDDRFAKMGKDNWLAGTDVKKDIFDGARYQGKLYGVPMGGDMSNVEVNKSLFQAPGVKAPPLTYDASLWSFDDVLETAKMLTKRAADGTPLQFGIQAASDFGGSGNPFSIVETWGGQTLSADWSKFLWAQDPGPAAWEWVMNLVKEYKVAASSAESAAGAFSYNNGKLAMLPHYVSQLSYHTEDVKNKFDWDQAPFPKKDNNPVKVMFWYSAWTMNAHGKHLDESFQLLQFISGPIGSSPGVELGWELPLFTSLDPSYNKTILGLGKNIKPAIDGFQHRITRHYYHQPRWNEAWTKYIMPALDQIFTGKKTASAALNEITPQVNTLLQEGAKLMGTV